MATTVTQRFPAGPAIDTDELLTAATGEPAGGRLTVGDPRVVDFLTAFARKLLAPSLARRFPELAPLGFFLRKAEIDRALSKVDTDENTLRFPRGLVFHVPPANVDTIFVYSWALSALAGNPNVVRISERSAGAATAVLEALNATLAEVRPEVADVIAATQRMVGYGHDDDVTAALSASCELRVIWGGDASVTNIRRHPLRPGSRDLTFPDRSSFTVVSVDGWRAASPADRKTAVLGFYNDSYWFDQAACSSPRAVFWVGDEAGAASARDEFRTLLVDLVTTRQPDIDASMAVEKRVSTYGLAVTGAATGIRFDTNAVATVELSTPEALPRRWLGTGTFPEATVASLDALVPLVRRRDQTVTHFGFDREALLAFAQALGGRGVDRIVPVGDALSFSSTWDGYDLLREMTRLTTLSTATTLGR